MQLHPRAILCRLYEARNSARLRLTKGEIGYLLEVTNRQYAMGSSSVEAGTVSWALGLISR